MLKIWELANTLTYSLIATTQFYSPTSQFFSAIVKQIAKEKKWDLIDLRLSLLNPVDLRGLPMIDKEKGLAKWLPPEFLPQDGVGILFLDEINKAPGSVMAAAYQLILDRKVGNYELPPKWRIISG